MSTYTRVHTYIHRYIYNTYIHTCIHTYIHTYTHNIYIRMYVLEHKVYALSICTYTYVSATHARHELHIYSYINIRITFFACIACKKCDADNAGRYIQLYGVK